MSGCPLQFVSIQLHNLESPQGCSTQHPTLSSHLVGTEEVNLVLPALFYLLIY